MKTTLLKLTQLLTLLVLFTITACSSESDDGIPTTPNDPDQMEDMEDDSPDETGGNDEDGDGIPDEEDIDADGDGLIEVSSLDALNEIRNDLSFSGKGSSIAGKNDFIGFELTKDLDFDDPNDYDDPSLLENYTTGNGWEPLGILTENSETSFNGIFEGNGFSIQNLFIDNTNDNKEYGLFGATGPSSEIRNVILNEVSINTAAFIVGGLVGYCGGSIESCSVDGEIRGRSDLGLLAGFFGGINISKCNTSGQVDGFDISISDTFVSESRGVGGLIGTVGFINTGPSNILTISECYSSANLNGTQSVGGLFGSVIVDAAPGTVQIEVSRSYATGNISGKDVLGGLIGGAGVTTITSCYATGNIVSSDEEFRTRLGGLVGSLFDSTINSSYASGNIINSINSDEGCIGGLVGFIDRSAINTSYSLSEITYSGIQDGLGGLVGRCLGFQGDPVENTISDTNYWNVETSNQEVSGGGAVGLSTADLQNPTDASGIYATWDPTLWDFGTNTQYPVLLNMPNGLENQR